MDGYTKEMAQIDQEMQRLRQSQGMDRLDILSQAYAYFEQSHEGLRTLLTSVQHDLQHQLDQLASRKEGLRQAKACLFEDMKECPYDLRATFHHDGKSGTGHYWAYVYVESSEVSLLEDMEPTRKAGWFKFCDASVTPVSEDAVWNDPVRPFSMLYADRSIRQFTRDQLNACIPDSLNDFIQADHACLQQEIEAYKHPKQPEEDDRVSIASSSSLQQFNAMVSAPEKEETEEKYMYTGEGFDQLKNKVNESMRLANSLASDDSVFLKKFEAFLARTQNRAALEHLYLLYSSEDGINEELSKQDNDLELIWNEYDDYREIGQQMVKALDYFVQQDHQHALESFLETKRQEAMWKTELMLNQEVAQAYPGLETLSFGGLIKRCGQYSLKVLNELAYAKAINPAYRMRGLEDGLRIAQQAQSMIADSTSTEGDVVHQQLQNRWLSFTDEIEGELSEQEANLLNTMIMTWFEGQSTEERVVGSKPLTLDMPLWQKYQQLRDTSESMLTL
ncbi:hypothetical protein EDC96DRAFT_452724 [Choanephora cucurbitarum]|nr:hypothetical protein EDC96DRAFT_452724 [Choanephora cucurbitarum]